MGEAAEVLLISKELKEKLPKLLPDKIDADYDENAIKYLLSAVLISISSISVPIYFDHIEIKHDSLEINCYSLYCNIVIHIWPSYYIPDCSVRTTFEVTASIIGGYNQQIVP